MNPRLAAFAVCVLLAVDAASASETVSFESLDADLTGGKATTIHAALFKPPGAGPFGAVVLLHGCGGLYRWEGRHNGEIVQRNVEWAERLSKSGYVVLLPDSFTPRGVHESCTVKDRPVDSSRERPRYAYAALLWLQGQRYVRANSVALMGWSNGGGTVLHTIAADSPGRPKVLPHGPCRFLRRKVANGRFWARQSGTARPVVDPERPSRTRICFPRSGRWVATYGSPFAAKACHTRLKRSTSIGRRESESFPGTGWSQSSTGQRRTP